MTLPRNYHSSEFSSDEAASVDDLAHIGGDRMGRQSDEEEQVGSSSRGENILINKLDLFYYFVNYRAIVIAIGKVVVPGFENLLFQLHHLLHIRLGVDCPHR